MADAVPTGPPVGVIVAGGRGRRIGGDKAIVELEGRPLIAYAVEALHAVCDEVVVVAKAGTVLPALAGLSAVWVEPDEPQHPLTGVVHALREAQGRPVLVLPVDLPLMDAGTLRLLLETDPAGAVAVVPRVHGRLQPLCALYRPEALAALEGFAVDGRATEIVEGIGICAVEAPDPTAFANVNRPEDLLQVAVLLTGG
jgi:molybdenum cofactor guanylyltransferase